MACQLNSDEIEDIILNTYNEGLGVTNITRFSRFGEEIDIDDEAKLTFCTEVRARLKFNGCPTQFTASKCRNAETVGDIISAAINGLVSEEDERSEGAAAERSVRGRGPRGGRTPRRR